MRWTSRTWFLLSAALLLSSYYVWKLGDAHVAKRQRLGQPDSAIGGAPTNTTPTNLSRFRLHSQPAVSTSGTAATLDPKEAEALLAERRAFPYRLRNTQLPLEKLLRLDSAILLNSALVDSARGIDLDVPSHLRAADEPGAYIVQLRGPVGPATYSALKRCAVEPVAYIPNNAFLIQGNSVVIDRVQGSLPVAAVIPYHPYFKLEESLLETAVQQNALPAGAALDVVFYRSEAGQGRETLLAAGAIILREESTPFGIKFTVQPAESGLVPLARLPGVETIEPSVSRVLANDLTRLTLGVATNSVDTNSYLGLTGSNVMVSLNDTGVEASHPDLTGRVFSNDTNSFTLVDYGSHGTHVGGIIAGSGSKSSTVSNAVGSVSGADFRGMAPHAKLFVLPIDLQTGPLVSDRFLIETTASTNVFISNNSWSYRVIRSYGSASANFDAAARDALPEVGGSQPLLFVFAAGNDGEGSDSGFGGIPNTISAPANAKNVITVGALESLRLLTNYTMATNITDEGGQTVTNVVTNYFYLGMTDSSNQVAFYSSRGNVGIGTEGQYGRFKPDLVAPGTFLVSTRATSFELSTNLPDYDALKSLNDDLGPYYRYDTGTSMAAPAVSGLLALLQEFYQQRWHLTNSPALMKALLINSARSVNSRYDLSPRTYINYQGWGGLSLSRTVPPLMADTNTPQSAWPTRFVDQSPTNVLSTGQSHTWRVSLSEEAQSFPLRISLVWTDPPGNPSAAVKLVNDLDLVVTNLDSGTVFYGNNILPDTDFNQSSISTDAPQNDVINNVENVFLREPLGSNYTVTVFARRVPVNAITQNTNTVAQDYALVVSSENRDLTNALPVFERTDQAFESRPVTVMTNGVVLLDQRVGANFPLTNSTSGDLSQWSFYVFTNVYDQSSIAAITNGTNVAFITFLPPNVSRPRSLEADLDLYISTNSALTNLDPVALAGAYKAVERGGSQYAVFTNAPIGSVFYIGIKSEDQQGAEYALVGLSSDLPFDTDDGQGRRFLRGFPISVPVPDGSPDQPGTTFMFAIGTTPGQVADITAHTHIIHESIGDLTGNLSHNDSFVVLNNHFSDLSQGQGGTNFVFDYDDSGYRIGRPTDGPGTLNNFLGGQIQGVWLLTMVDNALSHVGQVRDFSLLVTPFYNDPDGLEAVLPANRFAYFFTDVPSDVIRMTVQLSQMTGPLDVYVRREAVPTPTAYDKYAQLEPPTNSVSISTRDVPPLVAGRYYIGVFNPTAQTVRFRIKVLFERSLQKDLGDAFGAPDLPLLIKDDAVVTSSLNVTANREIIEARVAVRLDHPRVADLALHLISPDGTRLLLLENRGGLAATNLGSGVITNLVFVGFTDDTNQAKVPVKFATTPFDATFDVTNYPISDFESVTARAYAKGEVCDGWLVRDLGEGTNELGGFYAPTVISGPGAEGGTNFLSLGNGRLARELNTIPGKTYVLSFSARSATNRPALGQFYLGGALDRFFVGSAGTWTTVSRTFVATQQRTAIELGAGTSAPGLLVDSVSLTESGGILYFQPEERMKAIEGMSALGKWTLEITDTRGGPIGLSGELISWQLQLLLAPLSPPVIRLTNGVPYFGALTNDEIKYFAVDVPRRSGAATNLLFSPSDLRLLYSPSGLPSGEFPDDVVVDSAGAGGLEFLLLNTNTPPLLQPGQRYYLAISNLNTNEIADFVIEADLQSGNLDLLNLPTLTNGVVYTNVASATNEFTYYRLRVEPGAYEATIELTPSNGNVDLYVRKAEPVLAPLPTTDAYDYVSALTSTNVDLVLVSSNSFPVPLSAGDWYVGVYNADLVPVSYSIRATQKLGPVFIELTNGVAIDSSSLSATNLSTFYYLPIDTNGVTARFDLYNLTADAELLLNPDSIFDPTSARYRFASTNAKPVRVFLPAADTNSIVATWFAGVLPKDPAGCQFTLRATVFTNGVVPAQPLTNDLLSAGILFGTYDQPDTEYFQYTVSTNAKYVDFKLTPVDGNLDLYVVTNAPPPLPGTNRFDLASAFPGNTVERVRFVRGAPTAPLVPGPHTLAVVNREAYPTAYRLQVHEVAGGERLSLTENVPFENLALTNENDVYAVQIPSDALGAFFVLQTTETGASNQLHLALQKDLPVSGAVPDIQGVADGADREFLSITSGSTPVPLSPGLWLLSVSNRGPGHLAYEISYFLDHDKLSTTNAIKPAITLTNGGICLKWPSSAGAGYRLRGKTNWAEAVWEVVVPSFIAGGANLDYCEPLTTGYRYFEVLPLSTIPSGTNEVNILGVSLTSTNLCIEWASSSGSLYRVEGKADLSAAGWTLIDSIRSTGPTTTSCVPLSAGIGFYRVVEAGSVPSTGGMTLEQVKLEAGNLCLSWQSSAGARYRVEAKSGLDSSTWAPVSGSITATGALTTYCVPATGDQAYLRVVSLP